MALRRRFRPALAGLEPRTLLSGPADLPPACPAAVQGLASDAPPPTNRGFRLDQWSSLHDEYAARAASRKDRVVFLGDSVTFLWTDRLRTPRTEPIRGILRPAFAPRGQAGWNEEVAPLRAANFGIPGDTTSDLIWRVRHGELAGKPAVAVVLIGVNDLIQGAAPTQAAAGIGQVVATIRDVSPRTRVLLLGLLPAGAFGAPPGDAAIAATNALISGLGLCPGVRYFNTRKALPAAIGADGTVLIDSWNHPTPAGYLALARGLSGPIESLLSVSAASQTPWPRRSR